MDRPLTQKIPPFGRIFGFLAVSAVIRLLFVGRPLAIFPAIITVHVDSVQCFAGGTLPHVPEKCLKLRPFWADCDAPATVEIVVWTVGVITPLPHSFPRTVQWVTRHSMGGDHVDERLGTDTPT